MNPTFAQLPGLQKAAKMLQLQEQINTHHLYATWLLREFNSLNELTIYDDAFNRRANEMQIVCEWHTTQLMMLEKELNELR
jgi:hypothetical protein